MNRGRNGKNDVRLFLRPGRPEKANNLIINSLWIVFYVELHQLLPDVLQIENVKNIKKRAFLLVNYKKMIILLQSLLRYGIFNK